MTFIQKLLSAQRANASLLCIGLDTDPAKLPARVRSAADPQAEFNRRIIEATMDLVCAYKLNIAFYEAAGERGWSTVHRTLEAIPNTIVTIGDGKRGDIANTAERQAHLFFEDWKFDAVTLHPYMGRDSVLPFIGDASRGAFILAVTSNEGSKDFQRLTVKGRPLYEYVVRSAKKWNTLKNVGLVVGATRPRELKRVRAMAPELPILIPGIGAQQGDLAATVRYGCDRQGERAIINVGRSIIYASSNEDFADRARDAALKYRDEMRTIEEQYF